MNTRSSGRKDPSGATWLARLSAIIMILPASMAAGWILGYYAIDYWLQVFPWGSIVFTILGAGAGFYEIVTLLAPDRDKGDRFSDRKS
jgi:F0F1-type ATP synthase assembly protein I